VHRLPDRQAALPVRFWLMIHGGDHHGQLAAGDRKLLDGGVLAGQVHPSPDTVGGVQRQRGTRAGLAQRAVAADPLALLGLAVVEPVFWVG
jgi:hypothetical protein